MHKQQDIIKEVGDLVVEAVACGDISRTIELRTVARLMGEVIC